MKTKFVNPAPQIAQIRKIDLDYMPRTVNALFVTDDKVKHMSLKNQIAKATDLANKDIFLEF